MIINNNSLLVRIYDYSRIIDKKNLPHPPPTAVHDDITGMVGMVHAGSWLLEYLL
jgi:hypothetical protein